MRLSSFRRIERLPASAHPVLFQVLFLCACGEEHLGFVTEAELDWEPLGLDTRRTFLNLMTSKHDELGHELTEIALTRISAGEWPWSFFCYPEERPRPVTPSGFMLLAAGSTHAHSVGVAVRCPVCDSVSINVVTESHVDLPFWNDPTIGVVEHIFRDDALRTLDEFHAELNSGAFDERRLSL